MKSLCLCIYHKVNAKIEIKNNNKSDQIQKKLNVTMSSFKKISDCCKNIFPQVFFFPFESKLIIISRAIISIGMALNETETMGL